MTDFTACRNDRSTDEMIEPRFIVETIIDVTVAIGNPAERKVQISANKMKCAGASLSEIIDGKMA